MTYRFLGNAILSHIKQTFDDRDITLDQVVYWINIISKRLRYERIKKTKSEAYLVYFPSVTVLTDTATGRKYTVLPEAIVDLDNNIGIDTVTYCAADSNLCGCEDPLQNPFNRTSARAVQTLYGNPYRKPTSSNAYYYRSNYNISGVREEVIFYAGLECVDVICVDMWIFSNESPNHVCDLDTEVNLNEEQEKILYYEVLNLAKYGFLIQSDTKNDGSDTTNKGFRQGNAAPVQEEDSQSQQQA